MFGTKCISCGTKVGGLFNSNSFGDKDKPLCQMCALKEEELKKQTEKRNSTKFLIEACKKGDIEQAKYFISLGANIDSLETDGSGWTILMHTIYDKNTEISKYLINSGANINFCSSKGTTPLRLACDRDAELARYLIEKGAIINNGESPLSAAMDKPDLFRLLLSKCADLNHADDNGDTILMNAVRRNKRIDQSLINLLLQNCAHVNSKNKNGETALSLLMKDSTIRDINIASLLIANGADVNIIDSTGDPLIHYLYEEENDIIDIFINKGANINARSSVDGSTLLLKVIRYTRDLDRIQFLLDKGANINCADINGYTPLLQACRGGDCQKVRLILKNGCRINSINNKGENALMLLLQNKMREDCSEIAKLLINSGINVNAKSINGTCAIDFAKSNKYEEIETILKSKGCEHPRQLTKAEQNKIIEIIKNGQISELHAIIKGNENLEFHDGIYSYTPLMHACLYKDINVVKYLLEKGAAVNNTGGLSTTHLTEESSHSQSKRYTALMIACDSGQIEIAEALINSGANLNDYDYQFRTAYTRALNSNNVPLCEFLSSKGAVKVDDKKAEKVYSNWRLTPGEYWNDFSYELQND